MLYGALMARLRIVTWQVAATPSLRRHFEPLSTMPCYMGASSQSRKLGRNSRLTPDMVYETVHLCLSAHYIA